MDKQKKGDKIKTVKGEGYAEGKKINIPADKFANKVMSAWGKAKDAASKFGRPK